MLPLSFNKAQISVLTSFEIWVMPQKIKSSVFVLNKKYATLKRKKYF